MIALWALCNVLIPLSSHVTMEILLCKEPLVPFCKVNCHLKLKHVLDPVNKLCNILLFIAAIVEGQNN
jgi:hypothetical protein